MRTKLVVLFLSFTLLLSCTKSETPIKKSLHNNWTFKNVEDTNWLAAEVPGEVHSDLFRNKQIEDPFILDNEFKLQWISEKDWEYKSNFTLEFDILNKNYIELIYG